MGKSRGHTEMDFGIRVGTVVRRGNAVLLVRHQKPGRDPYWVLPGGRLEPGERIPACAERELKEEAGLRGEFAGILFVSEFLRRGRHTVDVTARVEVPPDAEPSLGSDPEVAPGAEPTLREVRWVEREELGEIPLLPPALKARLVLPDGGREVYLDADGS